MIYPACTCRGIKGNTHTTDVQHSRPISPSLPLSVCLSNSGLTRFSYYFTLSPRFCLALPDELPHVCQDASFAADECKKGRKLMGERSSRGEEQRVRCEKGVGGGGGVGDGEQLSIFSVNRNRPFGVQGLCSIILC